MRLTFVRRVALVLLCTGAAAACGHSDPTPPPASESATYLLKNIDGQGLPVIVQANAGGDTLTVIGEGLTLGPNGRATRTRTVRQVVAGGAPTVTTSSGQYTYQLTGTQITLAPVCPPGAASVRGESGTISAAALSLATEGVAGAPVWGYTRIGPD
jgi:hypothetical protein